MAEIIGRTASIVDGMPGIAAPVMESDPNSINTPCIIEVIDAPSVRAKIIQIIYTLFTPSECVCALIIHNGLCRLIHSRAYYPVPKSLTYSRIFVRQFCYYAAAALRLKPPEFRKKPP